MSQTQTGPIQPESLEDIDRRRAELNAALKKERRISRRQILLKKLWKLNKRQRDSQHEDLRSAK